MPMPCVLSLDNVGLIRPALCVERITVLDPAKLRDVCAALAVATMC
jgi:hypothetical protein